MGDRGSCGAAASIPRRWRIGRRNVAGGRVRRRITPWRTARRRRISLHNSAIRAYRNPVSACIHALHICRIVLPLQLVGCISQSTGTMGAPEQKAGSSADRSPLPGLPRGRTYDGASSSAQCRPTDGAPSGHVRRGLRGTGDHRLRIRATIGVIRAKLVESLRRTGKRRHHRTDRHHGAAGQQDRTGNCSCEQPLAGLSERTHFCPPLVGGDGTGAVDAAGTSRGRTCIHGFEQVST